MECLNRMVRFLLIFFLGLAFFSTASAETIVRHERTVHGSIPATEKAGDRWAEAAPPPAKLQTDDEVITSYGPYGGMGREKEVLEAGEASETPLEKQGGTLKQLSDEEVVRARLLKFIGQEPQDKDLWLRQGVEENLPYLDCIYLHGGSKGQEDYVVALRRQGNPEPLAPNLYSLVLMVGRGKLGEVGFDTEKMPYIEMENGGVPKERHFTESRVRLPEALMLRMEADWVNEAATAAKYYLRIYTQADVHNLEIPVEVRAMWADLLK